MTNNQAMTKIAMHDLQERHGILYGGAYEVAEARYAGNSVLSAFQHAEPQFTTNDYEAARSYALLLQEDADERDTGREYGIWKYNALTGRVVFMSTANYVRR